MALAIARTLLPDAPKLASAGLQSYGGPASPQAVRVLAERGIDLSGHRARQLTEAMMAEAEAVYTMTYTRQAGITEAFPRHQAKVALIDPEGRAIPDPIGGDLDAYRRTADALESAIRRRFRV